MVRVSVAAALVFCVASVAVAGNGSVKITGFTNLDINGDPVDDGPIDGVGVISYSNGGEFGSTTLHVVLTGLPELPEGQQYTMVGIVGDGNVPLFEETFTPNNGGNANIKDSTLGDVVVKEVLILDGNNLPVAVWPQPLGD